MYWQFISSKNDSLCLPIIGQEIMGRPIPQMPILPSVHQQKAGMLKQFSLVWEVAVGQWVHADTQGANLIAPEQGARFRARLFEWREATFPPHRRAVLDQLWTPRQWEESWARQNPWDDQI